MSIKKKTSYIVLILLMIFQISMVAVRAEEGVEEPVPYGVSDPSNGVINIWTGESVSFVIESGVFAVSEVVNSDSTIADVTAELVAYDTKTTVFDGSQRIWASDDLYKFKKNDDDTYTISANFGNDTVYLNIIGVPDGKASIGNAPQTTEPASIKVAKENDKFTFTDMGGNGIDSNPVDLYFNGWENFNGATNTNVADVKTMSLYRRSEKNLDGRIPGFEKVDTIIDGESYLIVAEMYNNLYALHPSTQKSGNERNKHVAKMTSEVQQITRCTVRGKESGTATIVSGGNTAATVNVYPEPVMIAGNDKVFATTINYHDNKTLTKLSISEGLSYDIKLHGELAGADNVSWYSSAPELILIAVNNGVAKLTVGNIDGNGTRQEYITVRYTLNGNVYSYSLPIVIYQSEGTPRGVYSMYVAQADNTTPYFAIIYKSDPDRKDYLVESQVGEVIHMAKTGSIAPSIDFFGTPINGYALSYMRDSGSTGNYNKIDNKDPTKCEFYIAGNTAGYNQRNRYGNEIVKNLVQDAIDKGCIGGMGYTLNYDQDNYRAVIFGSDRLPTLNVSPYQIIKANGETITLKGGEFGHVGDKVIFKIDVIKYGSEHGLNFRLKADGGLSTLLEGAYFVNADGTTKIDDNGNKITKISIYDALNENPTETVTHEYYVAYEITEKDVGKKVINTVELDEQFITDYSTSSIAAVAEANANINVVANAIPPLTNVTVIPKEPIVLPDGNKIDTNTTVQTHKVYYVKKGEEAVLTDFAGDNDVDCVGRVYHITTNNENVTDQFKHSEKNDHAMIFTATDDEVRDYIVAYVTTEENSDNHVWKVYAIKIVPLEDKIAGNTLTIGSTIGINYFVNFATVSDAQEHADKNNYKSTDGEKSGVDMTNLPAADDPGSYTMLFNGGSEARYINKTVKSGEQTYYGYSFSGVNAYEMGKPVKGVLFDANGNEVCSKDYSILKYAETAIAKDGNSTDPNKVKLINMLNDMLVYGAYSEQYAFAHSWINNTDDNMQKYVKNQNLSDVVPTDPAYNNGYGSISFKRANLEFEEGMRLSMNVYFTQSTDGSLVWKAGDSINATFGDLVKDGNGDITIPKEKFGSKTIDGTDYSYIKIKGLPPFYWSNSYKFFAKGEAPEKGLTYSVNSYCASNFQDSDVHLANLVKAMYNYGQSASIWYGNASQAYK